MTDPAALGAAIDAATQALSSDDQENTGKVWTALATPIATAIDTTGRAVVPKSGDFSAVIGDHYRVDASGGDVTATLPVPGAGNAGMDITFKKTTAGHSMILASASLIDGSASVSYAAQWTSVRVRSTGSTWDIV